MNDKSDDVLVAKTFVADIGLLAFGERYMDELLNRARMVSGALSAAGVPHAVIGGLAIRTFEALAHGGASLTTRDMDILLRRSDLDRASQALQPLGFNYRVVNSIPAFVLPGERFRNAIHILWAGEVVKQSPHPTPDFDETQLRESPEGYLCIDIKRLVFLKLTSFRPKDVAHLQDLAQWRLITQPIQDSLPADLKLRLDQVFEQNRVEGRDQDSDEIQ